MFGKALDLMKKQKKTADKSAGAGAKTRTQYPNSTPSLKLNGGII